MCSIFSGDSMCKRGKTLLSKTNRQLLLFIVLFQCVTAAALFFTYANINGFKQPSVRLGALACAHALLCAAVTVYCACGAKRESLNIKALYGFFFTFVTVFACGFVFIFSDFYSGALAPAALYALGCAVSLIFSAVKIITRGRGAKKPNIPLLAALCFFAPATVAYIFLKVADVGFDISLICFMWTTCLFLFLFAQLIHALLTAQSRWSAAARSAAATVILAVIAPQAGLILNKLFYNVFGDFNSAWFFIIAAVNGLSLLFDMSKTRFKLPLFYIRAAGFVYVAYFTVVFSPYMFFGLIGVLYYGLGLLVFAPAAISLKQAIMLLKDMKLLSRVYKKPVIAAVAALGFLTLPTLLSANFYIDRVNFQNAARYVSGGESGRRPKHYGAGENGLAP